MSLLFSRSLRSLDADRSAGSRRLQALLALLGAAWCTWFFGFRIPVLASADSARIEVTGAAHRVQAPVRGRVVAVQQALERSVAAGDVLVELDASAQERERDQKLAERRGLDAQLSALGQQLAAVRDTLSSQQLASRAHVEEADIRQKQARALARWSEGERARSESLLDAGVISVSDTLRRVSEDEQQRTEAVARSAAQRRVQADQRVAERERVQQVAELRAQATALEGQRASLVAALAEVERAIEQRRIRAPIAGRLGDVAPLTVGAFVEEGDWLASVIPEGELHIVAEFPPDEALGRIQSGQRARMRLFAFPWTQYGTLPAAVERVGQEVREGRVRVELSLAEPRALAVPIQHGLPGSVEIEIEEASPASLAWRAVGRRFAPARAQAAP